jgi:hypothetical protein
MKHLLPNKTPFFFNVVGGFLIAASVVMLFIMAGNIYGSENRVVYDIWVSALPYCILPFLIGVGLIGRRAWAFLLLFALIIAEIFVTMVSYTEELQLPIIVQLIFLLAIVAILWSCTITLLKFGNFPQVAELSFTNIVFVMALGIIAYHYHIAVKALPNFDNLQSFIGHAAHKKEPKKAESNTNTPQAAKDEAAPKEKEAAEAAAK